MLKLNPEAIDLGTLRRLWQGEAAAKRLARVLVNDSGSGVMRHADAGYDSAVACAARHGLNLPMVRP